MCYQQQLLFQENIFDISQKQRKLVLVVLVKLLQNLYGQTNSCVFRQCVFQMYFLHIMLFLYKHTYCIPLPNSLTLIFFNDNGVKNF